MNHWYLIYTKPRSESVAERHLERQGFHTYLPWLFGDHSSGSMRTAKVEPLFPRYLFVELDPEQQSVAPIRSTYGVSRIVTFGGRLTPVCGDLIEALKQEAAADGLHRLPKVNYRSGDPVRIVSGPFEGLKGVFHMPSGNDRVLILLDILGKTSRVNLGRNDIAGAEVIS